MSLLSCKPIDQITDSQRAFGLRMAIWEGISATSIYSVINNGFLVAYALALGANNLQLGVLAALPFMGQPFQIAATYVIDRFGLRKAVAMLFWAPAQTVWLLLALIPLFVDTPSGAAVAALLVLMGTRSVLVSAVTTSWNSWMRDLVPQSTLGAYFSRRLGISTMAAVVFGLLAAYAVDVWGARAAPGQVIYGYSGALAFGAVTLGLSSVVFMGMVPEPRMTRPEHAAPLMESLRKPLRDPEFKHLVWFLAAWSFATSIAIPFFTVHMLVQLGFALPLVIGLMALSQTVMAVFTGTWGKIADRYSFKTVLSLSGSLYLFVIFGWMFTSLPGPYVLTIPLAVVLLGLAGIAAAGINLGVETIGLKLAPEGQATPYLVAASLATSLGAALGPVVGGRMADFFRAREISVVIGWTGPEATGSVSAIYLTGFDFLFLGAFLLGLLTMVLLRGVRERGEVGTDVVLDELFSQGQGVSKSSSLQLGPGMTSSIPFTYLRHVPGLNVGVGAAVYEIRVAVRAAVEGLRRGNRLTSRLTRRLQSRLKPVLKEQSVEQVGGELTQEVAKGLVASAAEMNVTPEVMGAKAVESSATAMTRAGTPPEVAMHAAAKGAVLGMAEAGADVSRTAGDVIKAARSASGRIGMSREEAVQHASQGVVDALAEMNEEAATSTQNEEADSEAQEEQ